jgi:hypothetical protein
MWAPYVLSMGNDKGCPPPIDDGLWAIELGRHPLVTPTVGVNVDI